MESYWNEFKKADIELPKTILEYQRNLFNENIPADTLVCELKEAQEETPANPWDDLGFAIEGRDSAKYNICSFYLLAPSLKNYRVLLFKVSYDISQVYPCNISSIYSGDADTKCNTNEIFKENIKKILQSEAVNQLIGVLLAQVG